ncbi:hypothetical protein LX36DRAFT_663638 [Colletotrichum falcatum]|nr:hypothetical protein LX36DRAFT_663638 [Colletotrichum falcatum]
MEILVMLITGLILLVTNKPLPLSADPQARAEQGTGRTGSLDLAKRPVLFTERSTHRLPAPGCRPLGHFIPRPTASCRRSSLRSWVPGQGVYLTVDDI